MPKWLKAFIVWLLFPFLAHNLILALIQPIWDRGVNFRVFLDVEVLELALPPATFTAVVGTLVVWLLPIRRPIAAAFIGALTGGICLVVAEFYLMTYHGGFEKNVGHLMTAVFMFVPTCLAGAYAGVLRAKELQTIAA